MSAYDNKYWNHRIAELAEKVPATDDLSFFASEAYRDYTEQGVKDLICGTCTYLRTLGYDITEEQEKERISDMVVTMSTDKNMTACTNGDSMIIGVNNSLVKYYPSRELRHYAIQGLRVQETAHVLFTDFKTADRWHGALSNGNWWPKEPDHAANPDGAELTRILKKKEFSESFALIAGRIENAIEDGFIEREIKEMYKGLATTELCTTNDAQLSMASTFGEFLKAGRSAYSAMFQQILMYAKYDITFCICNQGFHFFDKRLCFGRGFVHFPVTCDNCFPKFFFHEILLLFTSLQVSTKYPPVTVIFLIYRSMPQYRAVLYLPDIQGKRRRLWRYETSYQRSRAG